MKLSDYFHISGYRVLSLFIGGLTMLFVGMFAGFQIGALCGASIALLASVILPISQYASDRPYIRIKQSIDQPLLTDQRVRFTVRGGTVGGFFLLTEKSMFFLSLEGGDHRLELSRDDVKSVVLGEDSTISVFLNNTQFIRLISLEVAPEELFAFLSDHGWPANG